MNKKFKFEEQIRHLSVILQNYETMMDIDD
jgi:hypothetical protein